MRSYARALTAGSQSDKTRARLAVLVGEVGTPYATRANASFKRAGHGRRKRPRSNRSWPPPYLAPALAWVACGVPAPKSLSPRPTRGPVHLEVPAGQVRPGDRQEEACDAADGFCEASGSVGEPSLPHEGLPLGVRHLALGELGGQSD